MAEDAPPAAPEKEAEPTMAAAGMERAPATAPPAAGMRGAGLTESQKWKPRSTKELIAAPQWKAVSLVGKPPGMVARQNEAMTQAIARRTEAQTHYRPVAFGSATVRISMEPPRYANDMPVGGSGWGNGAVVGVGSAMGPLWGQTAPRPISELTAEGHGNPFTSNVSQPPWEASVGVPRIPPPVTAEQLGITNSINVETYDLIKGFHQTQDKLFSDAAGEPFEPPAHSRAPTGLSTFKSQVPRLPESKIDDLTCIPAPLTSKPKTQRRESIPTPSGARFLDWPIGSPWTHPFLAGVRNPNAPKKKKVKPPPPVWDEPWTRFSNIPGPGEPGFRSVDNVEAMRRKWNFTGRFVGRPIGACVSQLGRDNRPQAAQHDPNCQHLGPGEYAPDAPVAYRGTLYGNIADSSKGPGEKKTSAFVSGTTRFVGPKNGFRGARELSPGTYGDAWARYDTAFNRDTGRFRRP